MDFEIQLTFSNNAEKELNRKKVRSLRKIWKNYHGVDYTIWSNFHVDYLD
jgi:hypothetical protein